MAGNLFLYFCSKDLFMNYYALIVAGGSGRRMGAGIPKQFLLLNGKPLLMHTLEAFYCYNPQMQLVLVLPTDAQLYWQELCTRHQFHIAHRVCDGGKSRFHSVQNGLKWIQEPGLVAIHDGARPLVSPAVIGRTFDAAAQYGNAVPVLPVQDSVRQLDANTNQPVSRDNLRLIQTPQTFKTLVIQQAYKQDYEPDFTDDATVVEKLGLKIHLVAGCPRNLKVTRPEDLALAEYYLQSSSH